MHPHNGGLSKQRSLDENPNQMHIQDVGLSNKDEYPHRCIDQRLKEASSTKTTKKKKG